MTLREIVDFWDAHGTKALGALASFFGAVQTTALAMNAASPPDHPFIAVKWLILLAGASTFFGTWTIKRGYYNSAQQAPQAIP